MLDDATLENYMATFYRYGNYSGDYWFIGKEEGGGETIEDNLARIQAWKGMGKKEILYPPLEQAAANITSTAATCTLILMKLLIYGGQP